MRRLRPLAVAAAVVAVIGGSAGPASATNDTYFARQWSLDQIGAPQAWTRSTGGGVTIGIVDTGVDAAHPDLAGKVVGTADCVGRPCTPGAAPDLHGHGTIVSGIAAAVTGNRRGVAGVAPDARLVVARALDRNGEGRVEDINNAIRWVVDNGARVVNLSLGDPNFQVSSALGTPLRAGIEYEWIKGAVPVLASGNFATGANAGSENYGNLNALVVGATDRARNVPAYSSVVGNAKWGLVAPGGAGSGGPDSNVISTFPVPLGGSGYASAGGTSMAAPHVAGTVALVMAQGLAAPAAVARVMATLDKGAACGRGCQGRLNAAAAVGADPSAPTATAAPPTTRAPSTTVPRTTTTRAPPTTTSTVPPGSQPADPTELAAPLPRAVPVPLEVASEASRNPAVIALAVVLVVGSGGAVGATAARRLRAGEPL